MSMWCVHVQTKFPTQAFFALDIPIYFPMTKQEVPLHETSTPACLPMVNGCIASLLPLQMPLQEVNMLTGYTPALTLKALIHFAHSS